MKMTAIERMTAIRVTFTPPFPRSVSYYGGLADLRRRSERDPSSASARCRSVRHHKNRNQAVRQSSGESCCYGEWSKHPSAGNLLGKDRIGQFKNIGSLLVFSLYYMLHSCDEKRDKRR